jgi:hypothetical protein
VRGSVRAQKDDDVCDLLWPQFLHMAAGATAIPTISRIARAETYPVVQSEQPCCMAIP